MGILTRAAAYDYGEHDNVVENLLRQYDYVYKKIATVSVLVNRTCGGNFDHRCPVCIDSAGNKQSP